MLLVRVNTGRAYIQVRSAVLQSEAAGQRQDEVQREHQRSAKDDPHAHILRGWRATVDRNQLQRPVGSAQ